MNRTARYLIAKYIPDLARLEPRNVGVIVWTPDTTEARFVAEISEKPGEVDGRSVPGFVTSLHAYKQWIKFWRTEIERTELNPGGCSIPSASPEFLAGLKAANKGNFVLVDGGELLDPIELNEADQLVDYLFSTLVESPRADEVRDVSLDEACDEMIENTNLDTNPHFHTRFALQCTVAPDIVEEYTFSHAVKNGTLERLYQRVPLSKWKLLMRKNVHDAAWMFDKVTSSKLIQHDKTGALVYVSEEQQAESDISRLLKVLGSVTRVINLRNRTEAMSEFRNAAQAASANH